MRKQAGTGRWMIPGRNKIRQLSGRYYGHKKTGGNCSSILPCFQSGPSKHETGDNWTWRSPSHWESQNCVRQRAKVEVEYIFDQMERRLTDWTSPARYIPWKTPENHTKWEGYSSNICRRPSWGDRSRYKNLKLMKQRVLNCWSGEQS
jgi:hypothetical protein